MTPPAAQHIVRPTPVAGGKRMATFLFKNLSVKLFPEAMLTRARTASGSRAQVHRLHRHPHRRLPSLHPDPKPKIPVPHAPAPPPKTPAGRAPTRPPKIPVPRAPTPPPGTRAGRVPIPRPSTPAGRAPSATPSRVRGAPTAPRKIVGSRGPGVSHARTSKAPTCASTPAAKTTPAATTRLRSSSRPGWRFWEHQRSRRFKGSTVS